MVINARNQTIETNSNHYPWTPISIKWTEYKDERTKNDGSVKTEKNLEAVADNLFFEKSRW